MADQIIPENIIKLIQIGLNLYVHPDPPLTVDGVVGPATIAALRQAATQMAGAIKK